MSVVWWLGRVQEIGVDAAAEDDTGDSIASGASSSSGPGSFDDEVVSNAMEPWRGAWNCIASTFSHDGYVKELQMDDLW